MLMGTWRLETPADMSPVSADAVGLLGSAGNPEKSKTLELECLVVVIFWPSGHLPVMTSFCLCR